MGALDFEQLRAEREDLRNYVIDHADSILAFKETGHPWFRREERADSVDSKRKIRHITTTASCIESMHDVPVYDGGGPPPPCPPEPGPIRDERDAVLAKFTQAALEADEKEWQSEEAARVYCRVRTLPVLLRLGEEKTLEQFGPIILAHLKRALETVEIDNPHAQGVSELPVDPPEQGPRHAYPPNAFHTYWTIRFVREYRSRAKGRGLPQIGKKLLEREAVSQLWARRTLATHTALISTEQPTFDAHQLAWALSTDVLCRASEDDQPTTGDRQHVELYAAALKAFFSQQDDGRWPLYEPLFHYPAAGNAYCYTYETLAELLRLSLHASSGRLLRDHLRPYATNLVDAWHYAHSTALRLENGGKGWCSGHHPHRTAAEAWATASVFSYLQNLRCLIGHWTAGEAERQLSVRPPSQASVQMARETLADRGDTWPLDSSPSAGQQLSMLFLNPIDATTRVYETIDHDRPLIEESRSAVLFGPPGTSKTTLVESLAGCLGWKYVEVHASDFLREGMDRVPAEADKIFLSLMELDHCVILFDEIDELIRVRDTGSSAPFGRFLTTSMLPKLAKLWSQRRVLFFVATNDIEVADPAIKRSQRFDAAIFVAPPAFEKKKKRLEALGVSVPLKLEEVESALNGGGSPPELGVFALLRWDQLDDLAHRIHVAERNDEHGKEALRNALEQLGGELAGSDWQKRKEKEETTTLSDMFEKWGRQELSERRDFRKAAVLRLGPDLNSRLPEGWPLYNGDSKYVKQNALVEAALKARDGVLELDAGAWKGLDRSGLYCFEKP
jgi:ATPase family associated with various cellular activities (AAA)